MEARSRSTRWTYAEFARLPSEGGTRYEVIDGELAVTPAPSLRHQRIVTDLGSLLNGFVREHGSGELYAGPVDVLFGEGDYMEPDIVFVRGDRAECLTDRGIEGPPDLIIEVLSPSTSDRDRGIKLERYRHFGVSEYWVIDPDTRAIEVWRLGREAAGPEVFGTKDRISWRPGPGDEALEFLVADVIAEG